MTTGPLPNRSANLTCFPPGAASVKSGAFCPTSSALAPPGQHQAGSRAEEKPPNDSPFQSHHPLLWFDVANPRPEPNPVREGELTGKSTE